MLRSVSTRRSVLAMGALGTCGWTALAQPACPKPDPVPDPVLFEARVQYLFDDGFLNPNQPDGPPVVLGRGLGFSWDRSEERTAPSIPSTATRQFATFGSAGGGLATVNQLRTVTTAQARLIDPLYAGGAQALSLDVYVKGPPGTPFMIDSRVLGGSLAAVRNPGNGTEQNLFAYHNSRFWNGPGSTAVEPAQSCSIAGRTSDRRPPGGPDGYTFATTLTQTVGGHAFHTGLCPFCPTTRYTYSTTAQIAWRVQAGPACCPQNGDLSNPFWNASNNCYIYALDKALVQAGRNPGGASFSCPVNKANVRAGLIADGLIPTSGPCETGCRVAVFVKDGACPGFWNGVFFRIGDFHFWRENNDGSWSHKRGKNLPEIASAGMPSPFPTTYGWYGQYEFEGFYCVPCVLSLPSPPPPAASPTPVVPDGVRVTIDALSGFANPVLETTDAGLLDRLRALQAAASEPIAARPILPGFNGFRLEVGAQVAGLPAFIEVRQGQVIFGTGSGASARRDTLGVAEYLAELGGEVLGWTCLTRQRCVGDISCDGAVDFNDVLLFLDRFAAGDLNADFSEDGVLDFNDLLAFLNLYNRAC